MHTFLWRLEIISVVSELSNAEKASIWRWHHVLVVGAIHRRESIMFQHSAPQEHSSTNMDAARAVLQDICAATANDVRPEVPGLFMDLVKALKRLDAPSLAQMHGDANGCTAAQ